MIKKITAYSFVLFANIIFLAHAVLPHHHHEQLVCIERAHCDDDIETFSHNSVEHNHQHDGTDNSTCVLKQVVFFPSSQGKNLKSFENSNDNHSQGFLISNFRYVDWQPLSNTVAPLPEFSSFFIAFVTPTLGLRAPPKV